jgi:hypothetical protein
MQVSPRCLCIGIFQKRVDRIPVFPDVWDWQPLRFETSVPQMRRRDLRLEILHQEGDEWILVEKDVHPWEERRIVSRSRNGPLQKLSEFNVLVEVSGVSEGEALRVRDRVRVSRFESMAWGVEV